MTTREPLRDVVARSLDEASPNWRIGALNKSVLEIAEHVDRLYVAVEKLTAAVQLIIDELKVGKPDDATRSAAKDSTGAP